MIRWRRYVHPIFVKHHIEYITVFYCIIGAVYYRTVLYTSHHTLYIFVGQRHFSLLRHRVGGGGPGALAGGELPGLHQEGQRPPDLGSSPVSITQYDTEQYTTVLPYLNLTRNNLHVIPTPNPLF